MAFTADEFRDLVRLIETHPEWRAELRRLVLTDELLALPEPVGVLTREVTALAVSQQRLEEQMTALTMQVTSLARSVQTFTDGVGELKGKSLEAEDEMMHTPHQCGQCLWWSSMTPPAEEVCGVCAWHSSSAGGASALSISPSGLSRSWPRYRAGSQCG